MRLQRAVAVEEPRAQGRGKRNGFTLVELLVVIGIIALLISILLPVLKKAREQANVAVCASNERQIYHALLLYAQNNQDWLPVPGAFGDPILPNQITAQSDAGAYDYTRGVIWPYIRGGPLVRQQLFLCPSDGPDRPVIINPTTPSVVDPMRQRNFSYNFNGGLLGKETTEMVPTDQGLVHGRTGMRLTRIIHPQNKLLIIEGLCPRDSIQAPLATMLNNVSGQPLSLLGTRHGALANQCFADGHVELFDPKVLNNQPLLKHYGMLDPADSSYLP